MNPRSRAIRKMQEIQDPREYGHDGKTLRLNAGRGRIVQRKPAQEAAKERGVMPMENPTGNPFVFKVKLPKDIESLQKLSVKVNLQKIGEAPRSYSEILQRAYDSQNMEDIRSATNRRWICDRFANIQDATRSLHPLTIQLLNEQRGIMFKSAKANLAPNIMSNPEEQHGQSQSAATRNTI